MLIYNVIHHKGRQQIQKANTDNMYNKYWLSSHKPARQDTAWQVLFGYTATRLEPRRPSFTPVVIYINGTINTITMHIIQKIQKTEIT